MTDAFRFNPWTPTGSDTVRRVYVSGPGLAGRSFLQLRGPVVELVGDGGVPVPPTVRQALDAFLLTQGVPAQLLSPGQGRALWQALCNLRVRALPGARDRAVVDAAAATDGERRFAPSGESKRAAAHGGQSHLDTASIKVPGPIHVLVDHREPAEIVAELRRAANTTVEVGALDSGDYLLNGHILVERKCVTDFESSIIDDNRLFLQSEKMKLDPEHLGVILLEGDLFGTAQRMSIPQISGALSYLGILQGLSIVPSLGPRHTAYLLIKMATHQASGLGYELTLRAKKPKAVLSAQRFLLEGLPGVSAGLAEELLRRFGSVRAIANATQAELLAVPGVGPKRASAILLVLESNVTEALA